MTPDTTNGRVTLAVLQNDIKHLSEKLDLYHEEMCKNHGDHEFRLRTLEGAKGWVVFRDVGAYVLALLAAAVAALTGRS